MEIKKLYLYMELSVEDLIPFKYYKLNIQHEMDGEPEDVDDPENIAIYVNY